MNTLSGKWSATAELVQDGFTAVVVTANKTLVPLASGYAKVISSKLARDNKDRVYVEIREPQAGGLTKMAGDNPDLKALVNWVESNTSTRRKSAEVYSSAIIYVERFDHISERFVTIIQSAVDAGLSAVIVGAADSHRPPNKDALSLFNQAKVINLPATSGGVVKVRNVSPRNSN